MGWTAGGENRGPGCGESVVGHVYEMEWQVQCHAMVFRSAAAGTAAIIIPIRRRHLMSVIIACKQS